ncbi:MAG: regulatory protein GemA [Gammaproteobacteria bacterium]|nr:regulatory protein GemA [Gammaproteobacteria bacterium]MBU1505817.1 regulatory protein GemA [Gammaproteobacteria bacterium]MBU2119505.1 regulatory protein GemA [Gammaproteobacteria bacterium]MBU2172589.1 regulatory protein GemA [Gammaproteobacteria bacterium]MBU2202047.1 regulatory protein GemA [Gammaproteobacteria bacterium]
MTTAKAPANNRRATLIKLIHVAKRELGQKSGLDDLAYRDILRAIGNTESLAAMDVPNMERVLAHMKSKGFQVRPKAGGRPLAVTPDARKVRALWLFLHVLGEVRDPSEKALAAYVNRIAKVDDLRWAGSRSIENLIETLKKWAMRRLPAAVAALRQEVVQLHRASPLSAAQIERVEYAQLCLHRGQGFDLHWWAWEALMQALEQPVAGDIQVLGQEAKA